MINSLEKMETVVENNRKSLRWNGWNVQELVKSPTAWMKPSGIFVDGVWYIQKTFSPSYNGWDIPNKFVRDDAK